MLSAQRHLFYRELQTRLQSVSVIVSPSYQEPTRQINELKNLQQWFTKSLGELHTFNEQSENPSQESSYLTEIHKQFRLLGIDISFLQGARQLRTQETRLKTIQERILILMGYCQAILES